MAPTPPMTAYYSINDYHSYDPFCIFHSEKELTLYVPVGSGTLYRESPYWVDFKNIVETDNFPASIDAAFVSHCTVTSGAGVITVCNETDRPVNISVYAINGRLAGREKVTGTCMIPVAPGLYIVKAGDKVHKVRVE